MTLSLVNHPVLCNYYVTYRCNASCSFCDIWEKPSPYVSLENVKQNLKELKKLRVKVVDFTGGEPLLHRELGLFLEEAKKLKFITTVTTNALLYPKRAEELKGKVDMLHFSLDFFDEKKHNESRNVDCFSHVMESVKLAKELGERPDILFTVTKESLGDVHSVHEFCLENDLVLILNPIFDYQGIEAQEEFSDNELAQLTSFGKKKNVFLNKAFLKLRKDGGNDINNPVCFAGENSVVISPENKLVLPCYHLGLEEFEIMDDLAELWDSHKVKVERKKAGVHEKCAGCTVNCYMQPSFTTHLSKYFFSSFKSSLKYNALKGTWKQLL